jgi:starch synthase
MKVELITREYPPFVYGGAGVHVEELSKVLRADLGSSNVNVRCFDGARSEDEKNNGVFGYGVPELESFSGEKLNPALSTMSVDLEIANDVAGADILHSHTWYANLAGYLGSKLNGIPHVISAHSLEPLRPWKAEQLGGGYDVSSWIEKTAYEAADGIVAVSNGMRDDILKSYPAVDPDKVYVVHNGVDLDSFKKTDEPTDVIERYGIDKNRPTAIFVGRITRQKGLTYFLEAANQIDKEVQIILCAGAPDTPEILKEVEEAFKGLNQTRGGVIWIEEMLPKHELTTILDFSDVFICPSIYEPLGIVNLEAMALKLPVVATRTGGIPDVVVDHETGRLVDIEQLQDGTGTPINPAKFASDFAAAVNETFADLETAKKWGEAGYQRAKDHFSWASISKKVIAVYEDVIAKYK